MLNPNAGTLSLERRWPLPSFGELAGRLVAEERMAVVLVGSTSEREYTSQVKALAAESAQASIFNLAGELDVRQLGALMEGAALVVTNDSGPMHLSAALGAPTVGLFGPETPIMYRPLGARATAIWRPPPCSPCINVHDNKVASCIWGRPECLVNIQVDEVLTRGRALMRGEDLELLPFVQPSPMPHDPEHPEHTRRF